MTQHKESACNAWDIGDPRYNHWVGKIPWRKKWQPTPVLLPGESHGQRSLVDYSPWGRKDSDTSEWLSMHLSARILKVYKEPLTGVSHVHSLDSLNVTFLFQGYTLGVASGSPKDKQNTYSKSKGRGWWGTQLPSARVQLEGQLVVTSSWWPYPGYIRGMII